MIAEVDVALNLSIQIKVLVTREFATNHHRLADVADVSASVRHWPGGFLLRGGDAGRTGDGRGCRLRRLRWTQGHRSIVFRACFPHFGTYFLFFICELVPVACAPHHPGCPCSAPAAAASTYAAIWPLVYRHILLTA